MFDQFRHKPASMHRQNRSIPFAGYMTYVNSSGETMHRCIAICRTAIHVSIHVVPYRYVERFYSDSDSGFCVRYIHLSRLQNDIFKAHFIGLAKTVSRGAVTGLYGEKYCRKLRDFTLCNIEREVDLPYFFTCLIVYSSRITPVFAHGDTADCQVTLNRLPLLINPYAIIR